MVRLRRWRADDAADVAVMATDEHLRRWSTLPEDPVAWLTAEMTEAHGPTRAICLADEDRALGRVALRLPGHASAAVTCAAMRDDDQPAGELSYWVVPSARGRGLARTAVSEMLALVARITDLRSVVLDIETGNAASIRIAQRVGAQRRQPERTVIDRRGAPQQMAVFVVDLRG